MATRLSLEQAFWVRVPAEQKNKRMNYEDLTSVQRRKYGILSEKTLSTKEKKEGPFALPAKKAYPIRDKAHGKAALSRAKQFASPSDQATIRRNVKSKFPGMEVEKDKPGKPSVKLGPTSKENKKVYD